MEGSSIWSYRRFAVIERGEEPDEEIKLPAVAFTLRNKHSVIAVSAWIRNVSSAWKQESDFDSRTMTTRFQQFQKPAKKMIEMRNEVGRRRSADAFTSGQTNEEAFYFAVFLPSLLDNC
jgi:hypothetical protein